MIDILIFLGITVVIGFMAGSLIAWRVDDHDTSRPDLQFDGERHAELWRAVVRLYLAGHWTVSGAVLPGDTQRELWDQVRHAADIPIGTQKLPDLQREQSLTKD